MKTHIICFVSKKSLHFIFRLHIVTQQDLFAQLKLQTTPIIVQG